MNRLPNIVRERLRAQVPDSHPDPDLLAAFAERSLRDRERATVLEHLSLCRDCREVVALAVPAESPSEIDTIPARRVPWLAWPILRWGALAACLVVVGSAVFLHQASRTASAPSAAKEVIVTMPQSPSPESEKQLLVYESKPKAHKPDLAAAPASSETASAALPSALLAEAKPEVQSGARLNRRAAAPVPAPPGPVVGVGGNADSTGPLELTLDKLDKKNQALRREQVQNLPLPQRAVVETAPTTQTVEVHAQAAAVDVTADAKVETEAVGSLGKAKGAGAGESTSMPSAAPAPASPLLDWAGTTGAPLSAKLQRAYQARNGVSRWTISSDGHVQHSTDSGRTWQPVVIADKASFRALSANGPDLWVGGASGLLYHSADAGQHWVQVKPVSGDAALAADIAAIEFTDILHGKITTTTGESWVTADGGQTWQKKN